MILTFLIWRQREHSQAWAPRRASRSFAVCNPNKLVRQSLLEHSSPAKGETFQYLMSHKKMVIFALVGKKRNALTRLRPTKSHLRTKRNVAPLLDPIQHYWYLCCNQPPIFHVEGIFREGKTSISYKDSSRLDRTAERTLFHSTATIQLSRGFI